ncbi:type IV pilus modification protein PilV [Pseudomonas sp. zfem005]|uniref:type IV pilus modification protein PilV n=1 Tax=Pseudomonas sp. zfem005 TaxID=3078200 RepID=UPI002927EF72|nr:type IV pilus modification protein PilV [Pseudomonas sp. zfem005]MDU9413337.1 type IV pilus modification protein PilV [Pseudomonas sp. zfem005]
MQIANFTRQQLGASLIEVLIALVIFAVGLLGFAALQLNALQSSGDSSQRTQATWVVQELAERVRANPEAALASYASAPNCSNLPAQRCADYYDPISGAKVNATNCTAAQMAAFDRWEAQCPYSGNNTYLADATAREGRYNSRDFMALAASGTPPLAVVASGTQLTITANWQSKAEKNSNGQNLSGSVQVQR